MTEEVTYFKSAGLREIEFARIVKASLQSGETAKSPQTSNPAPGWRICGDLAHFAPTRKRRATKIASFKTTHDDRKTEKSEHLGRSEPATSGIECNLAQASRLTRGHCAGTWGTAGAALVPPAWGTPGWRGWAHCGALWCFPHCLFEINRPLRHMCCS